MRIVSFDPGKKASWARYDTERPDLMELGDVDSTGVGRLQRPCGVHVASLIKDSDLVLVEEVGIRPAESNVSAFTFGMSFGVLLGVIQGAEKPLRTVTPKQWSVLLRSKKSDSLTEKKAASVALVRELWPRTREHLKNYQDHNKADAALMIRWFMDYGPGKDVKLRFSLLNQNIDDSGDPEIQEHET